MAYVSCKIGEIEKGAYSGESVYNCWLHLESANNRFTVFDYNNLTAQIGLRVGQKIRALVIVGVDKRYDVAERPLEFQVDSGSNQFCGELLGRADMRALLKGCRITVRTVKMFLDAVYIRAETEIGEILIPREGCRSPIDRTSTSKRPAFVRIVAQRLDLIGLV